MKVVYPVCCGVDVHKSFFIATIIQLTKCQQSLYLMFLTSELPALKMTFPTMLLKPLTSSLNIGTRQDMVLTLLKVLIL